MCSVLLAAGCVVCGYARVSGTGVKNFITQRILSRDNMGYKKSKQIGQMANSQNWFVRLIFKRFRRIALS
jgi:hypothetical protein